MRTAIFYNFIIEANLMAIIAILLMAVLRKLLRRQLGSGALCFGWLLVALRLLLPLSFANPLIHTIRSPFAPDAAIRPIAGQIRVRIGDLVGAVSRNLWRAGNKAGSRAVGDMRNSMETGVASIQLFHLYLAGLAIVVIWLIWRNARFLGALKKRRVGTLSDEQSARYLALCAALGVKPVPVHLVDPLPAAGLVGVFRPQIVLPLTVQPDEMDMALTHELCHLRNRDHLWSLVRLVCCAVHWFNPLVWMAASMSRTDLEMRCDDAATRTMDGAQKEHYARTLVEAAARRPLPDTALLGACMTMTGRRLKDRVSSVLKGKGPVRALSVAFMLLAAMSLAGAFATSETAAQRQADAGAFVQEKYIPDALPVRAELKNEEEAAAFAAEWITGMDVSFKDLTLMKSYRDGEWYLLYFSDAEKRTIYCEINRHGNFRTYRYETPVTTQTAPKDPGPEYRGDSAEKRELLKALYAQAEWLAPGLADYVVRTDVIGVWQDGADQYIALTAQTRDGYYEPYFTVHRSPDGVFRLIECTLAGNG